MIGRSTSRSALLLVWIVLGAFVLALAPAPAAHAQQTTLVVTGYGGRWSEVMKKVLVEPFEKKHNVKVDIVTGITTEWVAKILAAAPTTRPTTWCSATSRRSRSRASAASSTSATRRSPPTSRTSIRRPSSATPASPCSGAASAWPTAPTWGSRSPTSWKDFWDEAYAGKRATYVIGNTLGINFLFIVSKIFGKDYFDIDAGLAAIKRAQPKLVDFTGTVEKQLEQKEVVMAVLHDASTYDLQKRGIPVDWAAPSEGLPILDQIVQVTKGSKNKELAWKFIDAYISPEVQLAFATELFWSPTNKTVKIPADVAKKIISGPADVEKLCSSTGRRWPSSGRSGPRSGTRRCVDARRRRRARGTVALTGLVKRYGATLALDGVSLTVAPGEFFTLLGPSGCGKTTTLRSVAGFVDARRGRGGHRRRHRDPRAAAPAPGRDGLPALRAVPPPHGGPERGLRPAHAARARPRSRRRVADALALVQLPGHGERYPRSSRAASSSGSPWRARWSHAPRAAPRRAARRARQEAARPHEDRAQATPARGGRHHDLRDPRPGGGADHVRPHRGDAPRPGGAGGAAARALRDAGDRLRGQLHRQHQLALRDLRRRERGRVRRRADPRRRLGAGGRGRLGGAAPGAGPPRAGRRARHRPADDRRARRLPGRDRAVHPEGRRGLELQAVELGEVRFAAGARVRAGWAAGDARI